ncbi:RagB/SusD family nutrient uptake outer membrane protein [Barnesiella intestinihominis]|uniref:RagB/SusD family nutrient uptake outer membrane protein n=1 Tax=Barnesiella intestinihominis TaxID=487174 RepID=UPI0032C086F8
MIGVRFSESKCCRNFQCKKVLWLSMLLLTSFIVGCEDQERNNVTWGWGALVERYSFLSDFPAYDGGIAKYDYREAEDSVSLCVVLDYVDKPFVTAYFKKLEDSGFELKSDLRSYEKYKENQNYKLIVEVDIMSLTFKKIPWTKEPPMDPSDEWPLSTFEGIDGATAGNYRAVISWYGASFPLTFDVMCGNGMVGPVNTGRMRMEPAWNYTSTSTMGLWSSAYSAILGCNKALTAINEGKFSRDGVSDEQINNIKAENLFLRALAYFDLVRVYAQPYGYIKANGITGVEAMGVPIVLKDDLSARPSRNTVAEVYENLIIPDLVEAERLMSDSYVRAGVKDVVATVTKPVIQALMARVYLHHEDWQLAADYATKVIKNGRFRLLSGDRFVSMWDGSVDVAPQSGSEIIFEVYVSQSDGSRSDLGDYLTAPEVAGGAGYGDVRVSNDLIDLYDATDVRLTGLTKTNSKYPGYRWSTKYPGKGGLLAYNNVPVLRISEMYLIRSEAIYRGATVSGVTAIDDLNRVATNRNAEAYATVTLDNLFEESRKEFLFEGHIFFDMKRLQKSLVRTDYDLDPLMKNIDFPSYRWALPIPENDILNNDNIDQNPGY